MTREERLERQRLNRILADETYGPALVRLKRSEQNDILRLIERGDTREARQRILERDRARRTVVAERSRVRRHPTPTPDTRTLYIKALHKIRRIAGYDDVTRPSGDPGVERWKERMRRYPELRAQYATIINAPDDIVREYAFNEARAEISAFWYHA